MDGASARAGVDGHADIQTTMKYLHYAPRAGDARLVAEAFSVSEAGTSLTGEPV
jgi:hypothetical protein